MAALASRSCAPASSTPRDAKLTARFVRKNPTIVEGHRPTTLPGFTALARTLALWDGEIAKPNKAYCFINERLAALLLRSMTEGA